MKNLYVTQVRRQPETGSFHLVWSDGHEADLPYALVRGYCPCAGCQGHGDGKVIYRPPSRAVSPSSIEPVGNYALSIVWSDGHATGIYRFDFLRAMCPCAVCNPPGDHDPPRVIDTTRLG